MIFFTVIFHSLLSATLILYSNTGRAEVTTIMAYCDQAAPHLPQHETHKDKDARPDILFLR